VLGVQVTNIAGDSATQLASIFVSSQNTDVALPLCYLSGALVGLMAVIGVIYNLREASGTPSRPTKQTIDQGSAS
jgi:hypothetical protein